MTSTPTEATAVRNVLVSSISPEVWLAHGTCSCTRLLEAEQRLPYFSTGQDESLHCETRGGHVCCQEDLPALQRDTSHVLRVPAKSNFARPQL